MKLTVVGIGYVGASTALLLAQRNEVVVCDLSQQKLESIKNKKSPVAEEDMDRLIKEKELYIRVSDNQEEDYRSSDYVLIATPTNLNEKTRHLDTSTVESVIKDIVDSGSRATIVVKSTIPIGFMERMHKEYPEAILLSSPEFLREGHAMHDQLHPSRIVLGADLGCEKTKKAAENYAAAVKECTEEEDVKVLIMSYGEAEAVKLFSNTYLAMRVAFFNELDTFAEAEGYDSKRIIDGVCLEPRIGDFYNNPSFGYGGYCLPKDTKELLSSLGKLPNNLIRATVESNESRMNFINENIMKRLAGMEKPVIGVYRLIMENESSNFRESTVLSIMRILKEQGAEIIIYEPLLTEEKEMEGCQVLSNLDDFKAQSDLIIANRIGKDLEDVMEKVYTRDVYRRN